MAPPTSSVRQPTVVFRQNRQPDLNFRQKGYYPSLPLCTLVFFAAFVANVLNLVERQTRQWRLRLRCQLVTFRQNWQLIEGVSESGEQGADFIQCSLLPSEGCLPMAPPVVVLISS
jgi:hypothetical protein